MQTITLYSRDSLEVVTQVKVPFFRTMPEVLVWGSRFFARQSDGKYCEVFAHFIVEMPK